MIEKAKEILTEITEKIERFNYLVAEYENFKTSWDLFINIKITLDQLESEQVKIKNYTVEASKMYEDLEGINDILHIKKVEFFLSKWFEYPFWYQSEKAQRIERENNRIYRFQNRANPRQEYEASLLL